MPLNEFGKLFLIVGGIIFLLGLLLSFSGKIPYLGQLPGDILVKKKNFSFYFPLTTCIILSIVLTALLYFFTNIFRK
ncbi:MAG: hypothetical protein AMJ41_00865 [candidate division Zixibacteria bacterium DG_27]|nr:MAG: hypothetical protein AMJ41_00865 [candidate division Zixibacteria bacterium DG_27]